MGQIINYFNPGHKGRYLANVVLLAQGKIDYVPVCEYGSAHNSNRFQSYWPPTYEVSPYGDVEEYIVNTHYPDEAIAMMEQQSREYSVIQIVANRDSQEHIAENNFRKNYINKTANPSWWKLDIKRISDFTGLDMHDIDPYSLTEAQYDIVIQTIKLSNMLREMWRYRGSKPYHIIQYEDLYDEKEIEKLLNFCGTSINSTVKYYMNEHEDANESFCNRTYLGFR